jgi:hypothetical protein
MAAVTVTTLATSPAADLAALNTNFANTSAWAQTIADAFPLAAIARTASADGLTTGLIADGPLLQFISVTSASANNIITLPTPTPGTIVVLHVAATGYELRTSDPETIAINGGTEAGAESAIGANTTAILVCATATSWKGLQMGSDGTLAQVEAAAAA